MSEYTGMSPELDPNDSLWVSKISKILGPSVNEEGQAKIAFSESPDSAQFPFEQAGIEFRLSVDRLWKVIETNIDPAKEKLEYRFSTSINLIDEQGIMNVLSLAKTERIVLDDVANSVIITGTKPDDPRKFEVRVTPNGYSSAPVEDERGN